MRKLFAILLCILTCSCNTGKDKVSRAKLNSFKGLPPEIEGCGCYFAANERDFRNERFLFVSDLDSLAYVSVNKRLLRMKLVSTTRKDAIPDEQNYQNTYSNGLYKLVVTIPVRENTADEIWWNTGNMQLYFKEVLVAEKAVSGECGC